MRRVYYNKLVRDQIESKILGKGEACSVRKIEDNQEFQQELLKKVAEEAVGLSRSRSRAQFLQEYADLMIVLDALTAEMEFSPADIEVAMKENIEQKGLFKERTFLTWSEDKAYESSESPQGV